ncbi:hypothetical protein H696_06014 [Fonticula alba]|uniref:Uncharacterized protein n=1 Tax=Fonticula alba TaxID=691883 RepID=A0A058YZT7_FONAL|nr:hypothetical protein H696_06014 [Fonticula alba]KCV67494.1 hypothetical protein H696_06014 [Fonticula alba]|eukprot:XP_009498055.1 hypothetical protein H696_06014 [Fonticula alba]
MPDPAADAQAPPGAPVRAEAAVSSVFKALVSGAALGAGRPSFSSLLSGTPTPSSLSSASPSSSGPVDVSVGAGAGAPSAGAESASRPGPSAAKRDMSPAAGPSRSDPDPGGRSTDPVALDDTLQSDLIRYRRTLASTVHACKKLTAERVSLRSALNRLEQLHAGLHRERDRLDTLSANFMESLQAASAGLGIDPAAEQPPADLDGALRQLDESSAASLSALVWNSLQLSHWLQPFVDSLSNAPQPSEPSTPTADSVDSADLEELLQIERTDKAEQILSFQRRLDTARLALAQAEESARASEARAVAAERSAALAEHARSAAESQALGHSMECQRLEAALLESQRNQAAQLLAAQQQIDDLRDQLDSARSPGSPGSPAGETSPGLGPRAGAPAAGGTAAAAARVEANAIVTQAEIQALRTEVRHYREKALRAEREADTLRAQLASTRTDLSALRLEQEHALAAAAGRPASPPPVLAPEPEPAALAAAAALDAERATVSRLTHRRALPSLSPDWPPRRRHRSGALASQRPRAPGPRRARP